MADYLAAWDAFIAATTALDPEAPELIEMHRGEALAQVRGFIGDLRSKGHTNVGPLTHDARVVAVDGTEAVVHDCTDDQSVVRDATGAVVEPAVGKKGYDNRPRLEDGRWRTYTCSTRRRSAH